MNCVSLAVRDGVATVSIENPPVNALSWRVRSQLFEAVEGADSDPAVRVVILRGEGRTFPAGADIKEFGRPAVPPSLPEVCNRIEQVEKPVLAALHGTVLGGGLEVALAADFRIASAGALLGFPEVNLGIIPGAGGTQRAPRICGAGPALDLMLSGRPVGSRKALEIGLIDSVVDSGLDEAALVLASRLAAEGACGDPIPTAPAAATDPKLFAAAIGKARERVGKMHKKLLAPRRIVDCVEASQKLPPLEGMAMERQCFLECVSTEQSAALRHVFFAERIASRPPAATSATKLPIRQVGIVGGGTMGTGIAAAFLNAGYRVGLVENSPRLLARAENAVDSILENAVSRGLIDGSVKHERLSRFNAHLDLRDIADADLAIEAVYEDSSVKSSVLAGLAEVLGSRAIIATNTSYLNVDDLCARSGNPFYALGMHFFAPAHIMKAVEIVPASSTKPEVVEACFAVARRLGKFGIWAGPCEGFIGNRIRSAYREAADLMLLDGATPYQIDDALKEFGFPLGIYATQDLSGLDISWTRRKRFKKDLPEGRRYCPLGDMLCEAGRLGRKSGRGYYSYGKGPKGCADPEVLDLLREARRRAGYGDPPSPPDPERIVDRILAAMVNEAAKILDEGCARRPSDIDVVKVCGFGFPRWRGGPMRHADAVGAKALLASVESFAASDPLFWKPAPLLKRMAEEGISFADLDREAG